MTTVDLTSAIAGTVTSGSPVRADDVEHPFETVENLFQSGVDAQNLSHAEPLRGESFRKNALTEVFTRKSRSESWTTRPAFRSRNHTDIPGGALRFRLRAVADVHVFFTVAIERLNKQDKRWTGWEQYGGTEEHAQVRFRWACNGLWEGSDGEPGRHYLQAQTWLSSETRTGTGVSQRNWIDKVDVARGISFNWKIKPVDGIQPTTNVMPPVVPPEGNSDSRVISLFGSGGASSGLVAADRGRLQAGWHNIRHTMSWEREDGDLGGDGRGGPADADTLIFGNTELIVVANYGMAEDSNSVFQADQASGQQQQQQVSANVRGAIRKPQKVDG